jgi:hypothetical protein
VQRQQAVKRGAGGCKTLNRKKISIFFNNKKLGPI